MRIMPEFFKNYFKDFTDLTLDIDPNKLIKAKVIENSHRLNKKTIVIGKEVHLLQVIYLLISQKLLGSGLLILMKAVCLPVLEMTMAMRIGLSKRFEFLC